MNDKTSLSRTIVIAALALGVFGDVLLRATPWGLNVLCWLLPAPMRQTDAG